MGAGATPTGPDVAIIGGSGLYSFFEDPRPVDIETPYGSPSTGLQLGSLSGRAVAFLPRHGSDHRHPPHEINYRANLWALRMLGVRQVLAPCAVGSLRRELGPGTIVVPDQLVDRTTGRAQTYFSTGAVHVAFADPYCPVARAAVVDAVSAASVRVVAGGAMVVIDGPRFSTRAESQWYAHQGWSLVNMTGHPEAVLARELGLCYASVALVTDLDAGLHASDAVVQEEVFRVFRENVEKLRGLLVAAVAGLPDTRECICTRAHDGIELPIELPAA